MFRHLNIVKACLVMLCAGFTFGTANPETCSKNTCLRRVISNEKRAGKRACESFFETTLVPISYFTYTIYDEPGTTTTTFIGAKKTTTVTTTSAYTEINYVPSTFTVTSSIGGYRPSPTPSPKSQQEQQQRLLEDSRPDFLTRSATEVPLYVYHSCSNDTLMYSSACSCVGATHRTTSSRGTFTSSIQKQTSISYTETISITAKVATDEVIITETASKVTKTYGVKSITTSTNQAQCTVIDTHGYYGSYEYYNGPSYDNYYAGSGYEENKNNPGNDEKYYPPPATANYPDLGPNETCTAIQRCTFLALNSAFGSFDIHYLTHLRYWKCVLYFGVNNNASYFNVANPHISQGYGFTIT